MNSRDLAKCVNAVAWVFKIALAIFGVIAALAIVYALGWIVPGSIYVAHCWLGPLGALGVIVIWALLGKWTIELVRWARKKVGQ